MGTALSGLLRGFLDTTIALQKYDDRRQQEQQKIALLKERLGLQRDLLKGRQAHLKLQDLQQQGRLEELLRAYGRQLAGGAALPGAPAPAIAGARLPDVPGGAEVPPEAALVSPLHSLTPQDIWEASDATMEGLRHDDVAGLSDAQRLALRLRLARRQPSGR